MAGWQTLLSEEVYKTPWIRVRRDVVLNHTGKQLTYSVVELRHPAVYILAVNKQGKILLQHNFRYPISNYAWDLPAGHSDGQDLLVAAKRELLEETGLASDDWTDLGKLYQATGIGNIPGQVFVARDVHSAPGERDELEDIMEQQFMSQEEIEDLVREGKIDTTVTMAALYLARLHGLQKENKKL
jgi:8-oxo-dGTP pyrophosphatase MutT (NUDIX family)